MAADPRTVVTDSASAHIAYAGAPMRARGRALGVLSIVGQNGQQLSVDEVILLTSIADQVGVAVENIRLRRQAEQAAVLEERARLARELHDSITQSLYSLALFAEAGWKRAEAGEWEATRYNFRRIVETSQQALKEMRLLVHELRPLDLQREGLVGALHRRLRAVEGRVNIQARLVAEGLLELPRHIEEELYRMAQEALNNALKHAAATSVTISLRLAGEWVELEVVDDGTGFDPEVGVNNGGLGLHSIRERAERLGGSFTLLSAPGQGTQVKVRVKL
jgi:signal transduction histidine kinase